MDTDDCEKRSRLCNNDGQRVQENQQHVLEEKDRTKKGGMQSRRRPTVTRKPMTNVTNKIGSSRMRGKRKLASDAQGGSMMEIDEVEEQKQKMLKPGKAYLWS